jgi:hypothetical protein
MKLEVNLLFAEAMPIFGRDLRDDWEMPQLASSHNPCSPVRTAVCQPRAVITLNHQIPERPTTGVISVLLSKNDGSIAHL